MLVRSCRERKRSCFLIPSSLSVAGGDHSRSPHKAEYSTATTFGRWNYATFPRKKRSTHHNQLFETTLPTSQLTWHSTCIGIQWNLSNLTGGVLICEENCQVFLVHKKALQCTLISTTPVHLQVLSFSQLHGHSYLLVYVMLRICIWGFTWELKVFPECTHFSTTPAHLLIP